MTRLENQASFSFSLVFPLNSSAVLPLSASTGVITDLSVESGGFSTGDVDSLIITLEVTLFSNNPSTAGDFRYP